MKYASELQQLEHAIQTCKEYALPKRDLPGGFTVNPSLEVLAVEHTGLIDYLKDKSMPPESGEEILLVWKRADNGSVCFRPGYAHDFLALKMVNESISIKDIAQEGGVSPGEVNTVLSQAAEDHLILRAASKIQRDQSSLSQMVFDGYDYSTADVFTLQWHITQACDLHCRHCYDRTDRVKLPYEQALNVLDDLYDFCHQQNVFGQVTFTGGNPLLYPHFFDLYREAAERGFMLAILGNPTTESILDSISAIQRPEFFQVSLEGLAEHNDYIRGEGHFERTMAFLDLLNKKQFYSMVMLTLTKDNVDQVIKLANYLKGRVDRFVFNRLTLFGEGANLQPVPAEIYDEFLEEWLKAVDEDPALGVKDNLFNRVNYLQGKALFGGCAGFGCGAAFNFVSLLPGGEVHACRKFPSAIGNIFTHSLQEIYSSNQAEKYRQGCVECQDCVIETVCRGCPAVAAGHGLDPFLVKDPYCRGKITTKNESR